MAEKCAKCGTQLKLFRDGSFRIDGKRVCQPCFEQQGKNPESSLKSEVTAIEETAFPNQEIPEGDQPKRKPTPEQPSAKKCARCGAKFKFFRDSARQIDDDGKRVCQPCFKQWEQKKALVDALAPHEGMTMERFEEAIAWREGTSFKPLKLWKEFISAYEGACRLDKNLRGLYMPYLFGSVMAHLPEDASKWFLGQTLQETVFRHIALRAYADFFGGSGWLPVLDGYSPIEPYAATQDGNRALIEQMVKMNKPHSIHCINEGCGYISGNIDFMKKCAEWGCKRQHRITEQMVVDHLLSGYSEISFKCGCERGGKIVVKVNCPDCNNRLEILTSQYLRNLSSVTHDVEIQKWILDEHVQPPSDDKPCCFSLILGSGENITPNQMERFWTSLHTIKQPISFEVVGNGTKNTVEFQVMCSFEDKTHIANQLTGIFPNSTINQKGDDRDALVELIGGEAGLLEEHDASGLAFGLENHYSYPIRVLTSFDKTDSLSLLINALSEFETGEGGIFQALVTPLISWESHLDYLEMLGKMAHHDEFPNELRELPIPQKRRFPLFAVCLRVMGIRQKEKGQPQTLQMYETKVKDFLSTFHSPENHICIRSSKIGDESQGVPYVYHEITPELSDQELNSIVERKTHRAGFILNGRELTSVCHFPHRELQHPKLLRQDSTFAKAPDHLTKGDGLLIGVNEVFGERKEVFVPEEDRFRHMYVVGRTGTGKTTFLCNLIQSDIEAGKGVGLIDPHGDLVEKVLTNIPENRIDDVILFDPSDYEYPIGFNMMQVTSAQERRQMRTDILVAIRRLFEDASWGDNIDQLFRSAIAALLADTTQTHTLIDLRRMMSDDVFRSQVLRRINDEYLEEFWRDDFPNFTNTTIAAARRRLGSVLSEPEVRNVLTQRETPFNFKEMMDTKKIFLAKLSRGSLGEDISGLFGGLLVSKIQLTTMARDSQPEENRVPFYLYVDEFQNFVNEGFEVILSEARKYKLSLTMAHQFTAQLPRDLYNAVFGNVGTLISFATGVDDATALEKQLGKFSRDDILNLENFCTITRIGKAKDAFSMRTLPPAETDHDYSQQIRDASRAKYARPVQETPEAEPQPEVEEAPTPPREVEPEPEVVEQPDTPPPDEPPAKGENKSIDFYAE